MRKGDICKLFIVGFASIVVIAFTQPASAQSLGLVKVNQTAGKGLCLPERRASISSVLTKNKIHLFTGNNREPSKRNKTGVSNRRKLGYKDGRAKGVANVIYTVDNIGNGRFSAHKGVRFVFGNPGRSSKVSRRTMYDIQLNPGGQNISGVGSNKHGGTHNRALIAHELGHYVGRVLYGSYFKAVRSRCRLTRYAKKNRNEEFAEVFAAYITNPGLFAGKSKSCNRAFSFLARQFGEKNIGKSCKSRLKSLKGKTVKTSVASNATLDPKTIPVPTRRPDRPEDLEFLLPELDSIPIPTMRPDRLSDVVVYTDEEQVDTLIEQSLHVEAYYREAFRDQPLFDQTEDEGEEDEVEEESLEMVTAP